jgi:hypothetical protein
LEIKFTLLKLVLNNLKTQKFNSKNYYWIVLLLTIFTACGQNKKEATSPFKFLEAVDIFRSHVADSLKYLIPILDSVLESDQKYRYGSMNDETLTNFKLHNKEVISIDSTNTIKVSAILDRYGWLGKKDIGIMESQAIFFVIQHADSATQEKYLPLIRKAVMDKKENPHHLTMLEDRVSLRKNKYQIYGTQVIYEYRNKKYYLLPLIDPENVIKRRKSIGLDSISFQLYLNKFHIKWSFESYKRDLPEVQEFLLKSKTHLR